MQTYGCNDCKRRFRRERRTNSHENIWNDYVFHKQTLRELVTTTGFAKETIVTILNTHILEEKIHTPRPIHLVVDATYFGSRKDSTSWGVILLRDSDEKENLWWSYVITESTSGYLQGKIELERLGYTILSVTCDGFSGNIPVFKGIPLQMCHFHMKQIVVRNVTLNPQTEAGRVIFTLVQTLTYSSQEDFGRRLREYHVKYVSFLNEKTYHPDGSSSFTHEGVRAAYLSLVRWYPYLFIYTQNKLIPNTTNTCDGHFSHIKDIIRIHRGLNLFLKRKVLDSIFLASTIAPKDK